jgi:hypothetical protein
MKQSKPDPVASQFFEDEVDPNDAKARRLARQKAKEQESQPVPPPAPKKVATEAKERRLKRQEERPTPPPQEDAPRHIGASPSHIPELGIAAACKEWCVCIEDDIYSFYADGKKVGHISALSAGKIKRA